MRETKLILIEGIPGSGKSTLAHFLLRQLHASGIAARWWYEEDLAHPLYIFHDEADVQQIVGDVFSGRHAGVIETALAKWREFAASHAADQVVLFDSCLFGYLTWTLFPADVPVKEIAAYVTEVERIIAPLDACLLYLCQDDLATSLRRIRERRGGDTEQRFVDRACGSPYGERHQLHGFDGMVAFWEAYRRCTDALFRGFGCAKLAIKSSAGDWSAGERQALDFLSLPAVPELTLSEEELERCVGVYCSQQFPAERICVISAQHGRLTLDGLPGLWSSSGLIPMANGIFQIDSYPFEARFDVDASGTATGFRLEGPRLMGGGMGAEFRRVAALPPQESSTLDGNERERCEE